MTVISDGPHFKHSTSKDDISWEDRVTMQCLQCDGRGRIYIGLVATGDPLPADFATCPLCGGRGRTAIEVGKAYLRDNPEVAEVLRERWRGRHARRHGK
jgi:hypothetical protein